MSIACESFESGLPNFLTLYPLGYTLSPQQEGDEEDRQYIADMNSDVPHDE